MDQRPTNDDHGWASREEKDSSSSPAANPGLGKPEEPKTRETDPDSGDDPKGGAMDLISDN